MIQQLIAFSVRNKLIVALFLIFLVGFGSYQLRILPIDAVPDITNNQVQVITVSPSLGATDVERILTAPIEQALRNIPGLTEIRSFSRFGLSLITVVFDDETDIYWARQQVSERLSAIRNQIPAEQGNPEMGPVTTGLGEIYQYVLKPKPGYENQYDAVSLRTIQDWIVRRQLLGTPGVADVSSFGGKVKEYEVSINPDRLKSLGIGTNDILSALEHNNQNAGGAYLETGPNALFIRTEGLAESLDDIGQIPLAREEAGAPPLLLRDVADIRLGSALRYGALCQNQAGELAGGVVMMLKGENSSQVTEAVKQRLAEITAALPEGVELVPFIDRTKMIDTAIATVARNLLEGALVVLLTLLFFLGSWRAAALVASVIPLSMLFAAILMNFFHVSGNLMSLGALDFGLIVDGAVIITEAILFRFHQSVWVSPIPAETRNGLVVSESGRIMKAAIFGQLIILIVYLPILSLQGIEGRMFRPMAETVVFALIGAFVLSITYVPMMASWLLKPSKHTPWGTEAMKRAYQNVLQRILHKPLLATCSALLLAVLGGWLFTTLGGEFMPELEEGDFAIETRLMPGSSLSQNIQVTQDAAGLLLKRFPEIEQVVSKMGSGEIPTDPMPIEAADLMVILKPQNQWTSASTFNALADSIHQTLSGIPGVAFSIQYPVQMRFNELMTGAKQDVVVKIYGDQLDTLNRLAGELSQLVATIDGATEVYQERITGLPELLVTINRNALAQFGVDVATVNTAIHTAFAGMHAGQVFEGSRHFDIVVRLDSAMRNNPDVLKRLPVHVTNGRTIPLEQLADVRIQDGPSQIQRENAQRRITVGFNIRERDVASVVHDLEKLTQTSLHLPSGYFLEIGGQFENLQAASRRLSIAVPIGLLLIFLLLFFAFGKIGPALLVFSAVPLAAVGGVVSLWLRGMPFSISAGIGFIALFGVAVLNGVVLVSEFMHLRKQGLTHSRAVIRGSVNRLRPILLTASVASLGFLPMALSTSAGSEVQRPLATVVIGGLLTATLLTLGLLPTLYRWLMARSLKKMRKSAVALFLLIAVGMSSSSGQSYSFQTALDSACRNNALMQAQSMEIKALEMEKGTWLNLPKTQVYTEVGQFNSRANDNRFGFSQSGDFPTVWGLKKKELDLQVKLGQQTQRMQKRELTFALMDLFAEWYYLQQQFVLLQKADSLIQTVESKQLVRYQLGEISFADVALIQSERTAISLKKQDAQNRQAQLLPRFHWLTGLTSGAPLPDTLLWMQTQRTDTTQWYATSPDGKTAQLKLLLSKNAVGLEKAHLFPEWSIGASTQTIQGYQNIVGREEFYPPGYRFQSLQASLQIPLVFKPQRLRIKAASYRLQSEQWKNTWMQQAFNSGMQSAFIQLVGARIQLQTATNALLPSAQILWETANSRLQKGEINSVDWLVQTQQALDIHVKHLEILHQYLQAVNQFRYYAPNE